MDQEANDDVRWLSQLQSACEAGDTWTRLQTCVAASEICGGDYSDPDRFWFDALQDLTAKQHELRREDPHNWNRMDGEFFDRVNHAIRRWEQRVAQPEEDETMTTTATRTRKKARVKRKAEKPTEERSPLVDRLLDLVDIYDSSLLSIGVVKPLEVDGLLWATTQVNRVAKRLKSVEVYRLISADDFNGELASADPQKRKDNPLGSRHGITVRVDKSRYVLQGPALRVNERQVSSGIGDQIPETQSGARAKEEAVDHPEQPQDIPENIPAAGEAIHEIDTYDIDPAPWNPRQHFDQTSLKELAKSITTHGLLQPIVVRKNPENTPKRYQLVAGERRWRASKIAKKKRILARIVTLTDEEAKEACVVENLKRQDLNPIEKASSVKLLIDGCGLTQEQAAKRLGYGNASMVANELFLLELPEAWQQRIVSQEISPTHARHLRSWLKRENVLEGVGKDLATHLKHHDGHPPSAEDFKFMVWKSAERHSRTLTKSPYGESCEFSVTPKRKAELDVQKVPFRWGGSANRAFNVNLWNELNKDASSKRKAKEKASGSSKSRQSKQPTKSAPEKWEVESSKIAWFQRAIAGRLAEASSDDLFRVMIIVSGSYHWRDNGLLVLVDELTKRSKPRRQYERADESEVWSAIEEPDRRRLEDAVRLSLAKTFGPPEGKNAHGRWSTVNHLAALRQMADYFGVDFAAEWQPSIEDLKEYSDAKLRKMPAGKQASKDLLGDKLAGWMAMSWQAGEYIPREFKEPKRKAK